MAVLPEDLGPWEPALSATFCAMPNLFDFLSNKQNLEIKLLALIADVTNAPQPFK